MAEKKELNQGENIKNGSPKFVTSEELRSMAKLYQIVEKHGTVYINVKNDVPLKISKATLG